jgi:Antitoxin-like ribbon-helix-helix
MPKPNPVAEGLKLQAPVRKRRKQQEKTVLPAPEPGRAGRVLVGGHFAPEVQMALKITAAEERTTVQALLAEGINAVFARRRKPEIAA